MRIVLLADGLAADRGPPPAWGEAPLALEWLGDATVLDRNLAAVAALGATDIVLVVRSAPEAWRLAVGGRADVRIVPALRGPIERTLRARAHPEAPTLFLDARCAPGMEALGALRDPAPGEHVRLSTPDGPIAEAWGPGERTHLREVRIPSPPGARTFAELHRAALDAAGARVLVAPDAVVEPGAVLQGPVVVGPGARVRANANLSRCLVLAGTEVGPVTVEGAVLGGDRVWSAASDYVLRVEDPAYVAHRPPPRPLAVRARALAMRAVEIVSTAAALTVLSPVLTLFAAAVRLDSPGPVFYASDRLVAPETHADDPQGYAYRPARPVPHLVFRTMVVGADRLKVAAPNLYAGGPYHKYAEDERITRVGRLLRKTSVDELPLLWNVLRGRLGLVGLWPLPRGEAHALATRAFPLGSRDLTATARRRFEGRPGLAGLWQAGGRSKLSAETRAVYDAYQAVVHLEGPPAALLQGEYRRYATFWGQIRTVVRTVGRVLRRDGAL